MTCLLAARGVEVGRDGALLRGVEIECAEGQAWFVLGPNGSGKSSLLMTLLGLLPARAGTVAQAACIADRSGLGYVPQAQRFAQTLPMLAREFVELGAFDRRAARGERHAEAVAALAAVAIADLAERRLGELSQGEQRRALIARALVRRPRLLVLDEPTANLDPFVSRRIVFDLDALRARDGLCILHVSHDLAIAQRHATHVALVAAGTVRAGPAAAMFAAPELRRALGLEAADA
jgi:ABC-type Mn2+/Zn2+ transport system ATPase subunit